MTVSFDNIVPPVDSIRCSIELFVGRLISLSECQKNQGAEA